MTPPLHAILTRLMGRQPTLGELEEVRRSAVRDAMIDLMGEPARRCGRPVVGAAIPCTRHAGHAGTCWHDAEEVPRG